MNVDQTPPELEPTKALMEAKYGTAPVGQAPPETSPNEALEHARHHFEPIVAPRETRETDKELGPELAEKRRAFEAKHGPDDEEPTTRELLGIGDHPRAEYFPPPPPPGHTWDERLTSKAAQLAESFQMEPREYRALVTDVAAGLQAERVPTDEDAARARADLRRQWGDTYDARVAKITRVLAKAGVLEIVNEAGLGASVRWLKRFDELVTRVERHNRILELRKEYANG